MKLQLVKGETKETWGKGDASFDYWHRPLTYEEKYNVNSRIIWKTYRGKSDVDFTKTDPFELIRIAVTRIDRLYDSDDAKIDTIDKLLASSFDAGEIDKVAISMWVSIWVANNLSESQKKRSSPDSTLPATE